MTELLPRAFAALGSAPTARELALVADTLRDAGDREAVRALEAAVGDTEAFRALARVAVAAGSSGFVALDLVTQVTTGESAAPRPGGAERPRFEGTGGVPPPAVGSVVPPCHD